MNLSYGAELELADIDRTKALPEGCTWDLKDFSMVNSNGVAVDPKGVLYGYGGEVCTKPTSSMADQMAVFRDVMYTYPEAQVNYRSNLHIHVRVPGLKENLEALKTFQTIIHHWMPELLPVIEPIPKPTLAEYHSQEAFNGALARYKRRHRSHQMLLSDKRVAYQLEATTADEFFRREVPKDKDGDPMWHAQARCCVNLRQLLQTDTIEFRHFPGTTSPSQFEAALTWCFHFVKACLGERSLDYIRKYAQAVRKNLPQFKPYDHWMEEGYHLTTHDGTVPRAQIPANINKVLERELL